MTLLGLSEEELCTVLDVDPLTLLSGQLEHRPELPILLELLAEAEERAGAAVLRRWVRATGPHGKPIDRSCRGHKLRNPDPARSAGGHSADGTADLFPWSARSFALRPSITSIVSTTGLTLDEYAALLDASLRTVAWSEIGPAAAPGSSEP